MSPWLITDNPHDNHNDIACLKRRIVCLRFVLKHGFYVDGELPALLRLPNFDFATVREVAKSARYLDSLAHRKTVCRRDAVRVSHRAED